MKRAEVWRNGPGSWGYLVWDGEIPAREAPITERFDEGRIPVDGSAFPTHTEALTAAIKAVGLATPPEHREAP